MKIKTNQKPHPGQEAMYQLPHFAPPTPPVHQLLPVPFRSVPFHSGFYSFPMVTCTWWVLGLAVKVPWLGDVGGIARRVTCTWWLLGHVGLAVKVPWLGPCGPILALAAWTGFETLLSPCRGFISGREGCLGSERVYANQEC